ncbi:hypothetical protein ADUPG1_000935, partial [Aduncisulcus paluster]
GLGIRRSPKKFEALKKFTDVQDLSALRSFIGSMNYLKRYIPYYAELAKPITKLLSEKTKKFHWGAKQRQAAKKIIAALEKNTCLEHVRDDRELHMFTDASTVGIGGVLMQYHPSDKGLKEPAVVSFMSKTLTSVEARYTITELEAYAIFYCRDSGKKSHLQKREF